VNGGRRVIFFTGNDDAANKTVEELVGRLGVSPIPMGRFDEGGRFIHLGGLGVRHWNLVRLQR
jgi:predicted dinucleotide-binding enzyme